MVLFTDVMAKFQLSSSSAKVEMYHFYQTTSSKVNCVIVCCYKDGTIRLVEDLAEFEPSDDLLDVFIYAFNPMQQFAPVNTLLRRPVGVTNCYEVQIEVQTEVTLPESVAVKADAAQAPAPTRARTLEETKSKPAPSPQPVHFPKPASTKTARNPVVRSKTTPQSKPDELRSTALLQKMRKMREDQERDRREELARRRKLRDDKIANDPQRKREMEDLANMFDSDSASDAEQQPASVEPLASDPPTSQPPETIPASTSREPLDEAALGELLETTAEESLIETGPPAQAPEPTPTNEPETYIDEEGYTVTRRPAQRASSTPTKRARPAPSNSSSSSSTTPKQPKKHKQQSLMNFFNKRS